MANNDPPLSPASSQGYLLDSAKQSMNHLGLDLIEDQSILQSPSLNMYAMDLYESRRSQNPPRKSSSEGKMRTFLFQSPTQMHGSEHYDTRNTHLPVKSSSDAKMYSIKLDPRKDNKKVSMPESIDFDGYSDTKEPDFDLPEKSAKEDKNIFEESKLNIEMPPSPPRSSKSRRSFFFFGNHKNDDSFHLEKKHSINRRLSTKKSRTNSVITERRGSGSESPLPSPTKQVMPSSGLSFVGLVAMARKMGLISKVHAYEDYMSKDQFNMIKDLSTGRFDAKEEKRSEQMARLRHKLLINDDQVHRIQRKRTNIMDWKNKLMPTLKRMYQRFKKNIARVIQPNGTLRVIWDLYTMLLIFYDLVMLPLTIGFDITVPPQIEIWELFMVGSFLVDIMLNFNTGFYDKGMLVMDRKRIAVNYLKGWFWFDLVASFPYDHAVNGSSEYDNDNQNGNSLKLLRALRFLRFIKVLRFVRVFKLKRLFGKLESYIDASATATSIMAFLKLALIILFIAHWFACIWHYVAILELENYPETWLTTYGDVNDPWGDRYVDSIYWATTTMITVGYGDIIPVTTNEKLVTVVAMLVASAVFAYTMNRINVIMDGLETTSEQYQ